MKVNVYLPHTFKVDYDADLIVGVDYGAYLLAKNKLEMDVAIGDFDSVSDCEFNLIKKYAKKLIQLEVDKNETDSEAALMYLKAAGYSQINVYSDLGNRFDHLLLNYRLIEKYDYKFVSEHNEIFMLTKGSYKIKNTHQYLSLFTNGECTFSIKNVAYPLLERSISYFDTYLTSNRIINDFAEIEVISGNLIVVLSNDN